MQVGEPPKRENVILIGNGKDSVTWKPDFVKNGEDWKKHFSSLSKTVKDKFKGIRLKQTPMIYNPYGSVPSIDISLLDNIDTVLSKDNLEQYWNLLERSKSVCMLKFCIDADNAISSSKRAICIAAHSNTSETKIGTFLIKKNGKDIEWEKNYFNLLETTNKMTETKLENIDNSDEIDYLELPYRILKFEESKILMKMKEEIRKDENYLEESYKFRDFYELGDEMEDFSLLENCYDSDNSVDGKYWVFLVENKTVFEIRNGNNVGNNKVYFWKPSKVEDIEWDFEFKQLKKQISNYFDLQNNSRLSLTRQDTQERLSDANAICKYWGLSYMQLFLVCIVVLKFVFGFGFGYFVLIEGAEMADEPVCLQLEVRGDPNMEVCLFFSFLTRLFVR